MPTFRAMCYYHEGQLTHAQIKALEKALKANLAKHLAEYKFMVVWSEVPKGQGYTDNRLSDTSWIVIEAPDGMDQALREAALADISEDWARIAGVDPYNLMITLAEKSFADAYQALLGGRNAPEDQAGYMRRNLIRGLWHKFRHGFMQINVNFG